MVIDHDGLHGDTAKDGSVTLTAGIEHDLRIDYFEAGGGELLTLQWMPPGATTFAVVPTSASAPRPASPASPPPASSSARARTTPPATASSSTGSTRPTT